MIEPKVEMPGALIVLISVVGFIGVIAVLRPLIHWFWRVDEMADNLAAIRAALAPKKDQAEDEKPEV